MKLTGSQIVIETLIEQGVTDVFGYPGGQVLNIYDELYKAQDMVYSVLSLIEFVIDIEHLTAGIAENIGNTLFYQGFYNNL